VAIGVFLRAQEIERVAEKKSPAGWVVQVKVAGTALTANEAAGAARTPPSFQFFNVAMESPQKAVEAVRKKIKASEETPIRAVRALSEEEIDRLRLAPDAIKPA